MTITITVRPSNNWLEQIQTRLLDELTTGQVAELMALVARDLASRAMDAEASLT